MLAFVLMSGLVFANNDVIKKDNKKTKVIANFSKTTFTLLDLITKCHITHNVVDEEGNTMFTYVYDIEIPSSSSCKDQSEALKPFSNWMANGML